MRRNKKGSMELSVNSIVILVIAIVIMGLIIGFIRSKFAEVGGNLVTNEPDPQPASYGEPMTLSRDSAATIPGGQIVLKANVYNNAATQLTNATINLSCPSMGIQYTAKSLGKNMPDGSSASFIVTVSTTKLVTKAAHVCTAYLMYGSPPTSFANTITPKDVVITIN